MRRDNGARMRVAFDRFVFDSDRRELVDGTDSIHLAPKALRLLEVLVERRPRALSRQELLETIWPTTFVADCNLAGLVNDLRSALGDRSRPPRFIRTLHGFGYAFCAEVSESVAAGRAFVTFLDRRMPLREGLNVLGRDASADVQVDDATVSRRHAAIVISQDGQAWIEDLHSKNGTFIDGNALSGPAPLGEGQAVVLGDARIVFGGGAASTVTVRRSRARH